MIRSAVVVFVLLMSTLFVTGCGGGSTTSAPAATAQITPSASTVSFGSVIVGQTSSTQTVTLTNNGGAAATLSSVKLSDSTDFALMNGCASTLSPAASCMLTLTFKPQAAGSFTSTLTVVDSASNSPQTITITGNGTTAPVAQAVLSPASLTFAATLPGATAAAQTVTLTNPGTAALTISGVVLAGANPTAFAQTSTCGSTLAAGANCSISVTFTPSAVATYAASLTVTDSAASTNSIALTGSGSSATPAPQAVLSPASVSFASIAVGNKAGQSITLSNPGNATLTGVAVSIAGSGAFSETTTCGSTLAAGGSCTISVGFAPTVTGTQIATLVVSDNAAGLTQTASLSGTGTAAPAPVAALSATSITFGNTTLGTTSAAQSVTLSNTGNAALTISSVTLGGVNAASFAEMTTCGTSLAAGANCTISATFSPAAASTYTATITVVDNASGSPQTIALTGTGLAKSTGGTTFYAFPETDLSVTPLYALINNAQKTIDMTMYELVDTTFQADLVAACNRGVKVRVILDQSLEKSSNTPAYTQLNAVTNCSAAWSNPAFQATHEKSFIIDGTTLAIMSLNLTSRYYNTTRDFALVESDPSDIAAVQTTFNTDYGSTTDYSYTPPTGTDLIWSPTTAQVSLLGIINGATKTLLVENEEMSATNIVSALEAACARGVVVHIAMTDTGSYHANFSALEAAGCGVHTYPDNATALYIHAKALVADYGMATQNVYMGSINFSTASMTENRELGLFITDPASIQALYTAITSDYAGASPY